MLNFHIIACRYCNITQQHNSIQQWRVWRYMDLTPSSGRLKRYCTRYKFLSISQKFPHERKIREEKYISRIMLHYNHYLYSLARNIFIKYTNVRLDTKYTYLHSNINCKGHTVVYQISSTWKPEFPQFH